MFRSIFDKRTEPIEKGGEHRPGRGFDKVFLGNTRIWEPILQQFPSLGKDGNSLWQPGVTTSHLNEPRLRELKSIENGLIQASLR